MKTMKNFGSPEAYIGIGKNRQRIYSGENYKTVYLKNNQEFTLEFFNGTGSNIMAMISVNGELLSNSGLVIKPGLRTWIDCNPDNNKKLKFETYLVGKSEAVEAAIQNNGELKVEFFKEKQALRRFAKNIKRSFNGNGNCNNVNDVYYNNLGNTFNTLGAGVGTTLSNSTGDVTFNSMSFFDTSQTFKDFPAENNVKSSLTSSVPEIPKSKKETGRIEEGSHSNQSFKTVSMEFHSFPFETVEYKLLPVSEKPILAEDLKMKCDSCGMNLKQGWKVCPVCETPIKKELVCNHCDYKLEIGWNLCPSCGKPIG